MTSQERIAFLDIKSREDLADFLGLKLKTLTFYAYSQAKLYTPFSVGKKTEGQIRLIYAPSAGLKKVQRSLALELNSIYNPPINVHGFACNRSIVTNASHHTGSPIILNMDLKDFFPSIAEKRVQGLFRNKPFCFPTSVASALAGLCCYRGCLPQGAPTSPILSNMICRQLDRQLASFAYSHKVYYTRYADDITFSSKSLRAMNRLFSYSDNMDLRINDDIRTIIESNGFQINEDKTRVARKTERQMVTGVVVNRKCNFTREEYRTLRVVFNNWKVRGIDYAAEQYVDHDDDYRKRLCREGESIPSEEAFKRHIRGRLEYYTMIDSANDTPSTSLERLWTMYYNLTGEVVPRSAVTRSLFILRSAYDYTDPITAKTEVVAADGTCFATDTGHLITCNHCVANQGMPDDLPDDCSCVISSYPSDKQLVDVRINEFRRGLDYDYAVTTLPEALKAIPVLHVNKSDLPVVGQMVKGAGFVFDRGLARVRELSFPIISCIDPGKVYRIAGPFIKGMSGGPVLNKRGELIGILTHGSDPGDYHQDGMFLAIKFVMDDLARRQGEAANAGT